MRRVWVDSQAKPQRRRCEMDHDDLPATNDEGARPTDKSESWLAEQARLILLEDGS